MTRNFATLPNTITPAKGGAQADTYDMLRDSLRNVPDIVGMVLLSNDGLSVAAYGIDTAEAQRIAAACGGMASLANNLSNAVLGGSVHHQVLAMQARNIIITGCGDGSTLLVVVRASAQVGLALAETARKARAYAEQMTTQPRADLPTR